jgi:hypothetical protein
MMAILQKVMLQRLKTDSGNLLTHTGFNIWLTVVSTVL